MFSKKFAAAVIITALAFTPAWAAGEVAGAASQDVSNEAAADIAAHETVPAQPAPPAERSKDQTVQPQEKPAFEMPEVYREALSFVKQNRAELQGELEKLLSEGKGKEAARKLGAAFSREHGGSAAYLAFFSLKFLPRVDKSLDEQAKFMAQFLRGYGDSGVLLFSTGALSGFNVYSKDGSGPWENGSTEAAMSGQKTGRVFKKNGIVVIPFAKGEIFRVNLVGRESGEMKMCKIMPGGANIKSWTGGKWEREVSVSGDKVF